MTEYLEVSLTKSLEFRRDFKSDIYGIHGESIFYPSIRQSGIKVDTGAHGILIPLRTLCWTDAQIQKVLDDAIQNSRKSLSVINGVESIDNMTSNQLQNESENFIKSFPGVAIITPFTTGNILFGMDIIKKMDNHIGTSRVTGETTLLACPENKITSSYLDALYIHFGIIKK